MKLKKILVIALCTASAVLSVSAAGNFAKTKEYTDGTFKDLAKDKWYYNEIVSSYELGFMNGTSQSTFSAEGNVTVAQGITVAARIHSIYNGGTGEFTQGEPWYQVYVDYAVQNGFVKEGQFDSYTRNIKRIEMATLFADALPESEFAAKNNVTAIPDVSKNEQSYKKLLMLYNAGIVMGSDDYGNFYPQNDIKRSEASAIINRVALPENRLSKELSIKSYENGVYLADSTGFQPSGWNYDDRFAAFTTDGSAKSTVLDNDANKFVNLNRTFAPKSSGLLELDLQLELKDKKEGVYFRFTNDDNKDALNLVSKEGYLYSGNQKLIVPFDHADDGNFNLNIKANLDADIAQVYINGTYAGSVKMENEAISKYEMGVTKEGVGGFTVQWTRLYTNYMVNEVFMNAPLGTLPSDWSFDGNFALDTKYGLNSVDVVSMLIDAKESGNNVATKSFAPVKGNITAQSQILLPTGQSGAYFAITSAGTEVVKIATDGNTFKSGNGTELRKYTDNIWQLLRIEADTQTQKAIIKIDGKVCAEVDFENAAQFIDGVKVGFDATQEAKMWFDDVAVWSYKEAEDYVPEPVVASSDDYYVGMNYCPIWREGHHNMGWDKVSAFPENEPVLGYYDDGSSETMDWEIKFMAEHGIDYMHICWYAPSVHMDQPIKKSRYDNSIHDGYFNAKYSDKVKFMIMWENEAMGCTNFEEFKSNVWNYWKEYYFSDPRYMTIENMPILTIYRLGNVVNTFGGQAGAKEAIEFMKEDIKTLGYDGMIILFSDEHTRNGFRFNQMAGIGADGTFAYNWPAFGHDAQKQIEAHEDFRTNYGIYFMPSISTGFNDLGWTGERSPVLPVDGMTQVSEYVKDTYLPTYEADSWKSKAVLYSNWNEYGEGTYIMPTKDLFGFGYLDVIRNTFTNAQGEHKDTVPTDAQKARINNLYDANRTFMKAFDLDEPKVSDVKLNINGLNQALRYAPEMEKDEVYIALDTERGLLTTLRFFYEYNRKSGALALYTQDNTKVEFTVGSDKAYVNGVEKALAKQVTLFDGLPVIPFKFLCENVGFKLEIKDNTVNIFTLNMEYSDVILARKPYNWEWDVPGDMEGWANLMNLTLNVENGCINGEAVRYDPAITSPALSVNAAQYPQIKVRMKHDLGENASSMQLFFTTASSPSFDEAKSVTLALEGKNSGGEFIEYTLDMSTNPRWLGTITRIRFDPFTPTGTFSIDYIKLVEDENFIKEQQKAEAEKESETPVVLNDNKDVAGNKRFETLQNGDAQGEGNPFYTPGSSVSIITESGNEKNKVYFVDGGEKILYPYIRQNIVYIPGATYKVSFDAKIAPQSPVKSTSLQFNAVYQDEYSKNYDHPLEQVNINADEWSHFEGEFTVGNSSDRSMDQFAVYANPVEKTTAKYLIDNMTIELIKEAPQNQEPVVNNNPELLTNGDAQDKDNCTFVTYHEGNSYVSIIEDPDNKDNYVYEVKAPEKGMNWTYIVQPVTWESGKTYVVEFDYKIVSKNMGIPYVKQTALSFNAIYNADDGSVDHPLESMLGGTDIGWVHYKQEFTIKASADRSGDKFAVFCDPVGDCSVTYYIDNASVKLK